MALAFSAPSYIYQSPSGYIFRFRVPKDLQQVVSRTEFRYSLRAGALRVAKIRARAIASFIQQLFEKVRKRMVEYTPKQILELVKNHVGDVIHNGAGIETLPGIAIDGNPVMTPSYLEQSNGQVLLSPERIKEITLEYIRETLANDEKARATMGTSGDALSPLEASTMTADEAKAILQSVTRWLSQGDHSLMNSITEKILVREGADADHHSETFKVLGRELLKAFQSVLQVRVKRSGGNYSTPDEELIPILKQQPVAIPAPTTEPVKAKRAPLFSEVLESYLVEVEKAESWTAKTKAENLSIFDLFTRVMGDISVDQIDRKLLSEYKSTLMKLPPNLNKMAEYKDKSIAEVIASKPKKTLTVNTINKYIRRMSGLFNYAARNGDMLTNPASGLQIKSQKRADQEREAYTQEDLRKLFECDEFRKDDRKTYTFWSPLIALYSGCRLEEICQLHLDDIRQEGGTWVFDINSKGEKVLKNLSSVRLVPIHPQLIALGLLEHAEQLRAKGKTRLFPELHRRRDGYGQTVSKWYQRYKQRCGIDGAKTFHSFRHTFITHLKHKQVEIYMIYQLDGHAIDSQTMGRYGKPYPPEILLKQAIEKIDYGIEIG